MSADQHLGPECTGPTEYDLTCTYTGSTAGGPLCGKPATMHLLWRRADGYEGASLACTEHGLLGIDWGAVDHHSTADSACGIPSAMWIVGDPSRCDLDFSGVEPVLTGTAELVGVVAGYG
jgi:hypothetical protein